MVGRPRLTAVGGAGRTLRAGAATPSALPIGGTATFAVSARAVRECVGAWAATQSAGRRPDGMAWRDGLAVASAIVEAAHALLPSGATGEPGAGPPAPWEVPVSVSREPQDLVRRTYLRADRVRAVVDLLVSARVLDLVERTGDEWQVRLRSEVFEDAPVLAAVAWDMVRDRLGLSTGAPAALAIVRELARRTSPGARADRHFERLTFLEIGELTGFGKSALRTGLTACIRGRLLEARTRERVASYYRLLPAAFGRGDAYHTDLDEAHGPAAADRGADDLDVVDVPRRSRVASAAVMSAVGAGRRARGAAAGATIPAAARGPAPVIAAASARPVVSDDPREVVPVPVPTVPGADPVVPPVRSTTLVAAALVIEVNGIPVPLPPGARPVLEQDEAGTYWYRVGTMRFGPISLG